MKIILIASLLTLISKSISAAELKCELTVSKDSVLRTQVLIEDDKSPGEYENVISNLRGIAIDEKNGWVTIALENISAGVFTYTSALASQTVLFLALDGKNESGTMEYRIN